MDPEHTTALKTWSIMGLMTALFIISWVLFGGAFFETYGVTSVAPWVIVTAAFLVYAVALLLNIQRTPWLVGSAASSFSALLFFANGNTQPIGNIPAFLFVLVGAAVLFGFLMWGARRASVERAERLRVQPHRVIPLGLGRAFTGFAIAIALFFLVSPLPTLIVPEVGMPEAVLSRVVLPIARLAGADIPRGADQLTVDEIGAMTAMLEEGPETVLQPSTVTLLQQSGIDVEGKDGLADILADDELFTAIRMDIRRSLEQTSSTVLQERRRALSDQFGVDLRGDETLAAVFGRAFSTEFLGGGDVPDDLQGIVLIVLAFGLFGAIRLIAIPMVWVIVFFAWIIVRVLMRTNIIVVEETVVAKERFVL